MDIANKGDFIQSLPDDKFEAGSIKFNIPPPKKDSLNGEGVWGWISPEDKRKYDDDKFNGKITAILLNQPLNYFGILNWGDEVVLQCHGSNRPTLDLDWIREHIFDQNPELQY